MCSLVALPQAWAVASASVGKGQPTCVSSFILSNGGSLSGGVMGQSVIRTLITVEAA